MASSVTKKLFFAWLVLQLLNVVTMAADDETDDESSPCAAYEKDGFECDMSLSTTESGAYDCVCNKKGTPIITTNAGGKLEVPIDPLPPSQEINVSVFARFHIRGQSQSFTLRGNKCENVTQKMVRSIDSNNHCVQICKEKNCGQCKHMIPIRRGGWSNLRRFRMVGKVESIKNC